MDDQELIRAAKAVHLRLTGFRGTRWERNWPLARPRVIQALLQSKTLPRLKQALNVLVGQDQGLLELRGLTEDQLRDRISDDRKPERVLLALLSSPDPELKQRIKRLFDYMRTTGVLSGWLSAEQEPTGEQEQVRGELDALRQQRAAWQSAELLLKERVTNLETEIASLEAARERSQRLWETERQSLLSRLADRETKLQQREQKLAEFARQESQETLTEQRPSVQEQQRTRPAVLLVGNIVPGTAEIKDQHQLVHILPGDVHQGLARAAVNQAEEVWLLTYATPLPIQRQLQREAADRLRCFASYEELLTFIEQGRVE